MRDGRRTVAGKRAVGMSGADFAIERGVVGPTAGVAIGTAMVTALVVGTVRRMPTGKWMRASSRRFGHLSLLKILKILKFARNAFVLVPSIYSSSSATGLGVTYLVVGGSVGATVGC